MKTKSALFDLAPDSAGLIPEPILEQWANSDKNELAHQLILAPYILKGSIACSDSVGLSKLSEEIDIFETLKLIELPKQILNVVFNAIGGKAIGTWAADNSLTFFNADININNIIQATSTALTTINNNSKVQVGLCIHSGNFISFGNELIGSDLDFCNQIAENHSRAQELLLTEKVAKTASNLETQERVDLSFEQKIYSLRYSQTKTINPTVLSPTYQAAYDSEFFSLLQNNKTEKLLERLVTNQFICFVSIANKNFSEFLLDHYQNRIDIIKILKTIENEFSLKSIKTDGKISIFKNDDYMQIIKLAKRIFSAFSNQDYDIKIAITYGDILLFNLPKDRTEVAGHPINVASKIAEDAPANYGIFIHDSVPNTYKAMHEGTAFNFIISGIQLNGIILN